MACDSRNALIAAVVAVAVAGISYGECRPVTILDQPGWCNWCPSPAHLPDGRVALAFSRWPTEFGFESWKSKSEIALAISKSGPLGPYEFVGTILPGSGVEGDFDRDVTHNPCLFVDGGKFYLYYMGTNSGDDHNRTSGIVGSDAWKYCGRHQQVGVAVADRVEGPYRRMGKPLFELAPDMTTMSNPAICRMPNGKYLIIVKWGEADGIPRDYPKCRVNHFAAVGDSPLGPFTIVNREIFSVPCANFPGEDPYLWTEGDTICCAIHDMGHFYSPEERALIRFESKDGVNWTNKGVLFPRGMISRLERPAILCGDDGSRLLFAAAKPDASSPNSMIVAYPGVVVGSSGKNRHCAGTQITVSRDGSVRTLAEALARTRWLRRTAAVASNETIVVSLSPGRHFVERTLVLTPEDSHLLFAGPDEGSAVMDGGVELRPFVPGEDGIWRAPAPEGCIGQLWVNGRRALNAKTPNGDGYLYMANEDPAMPNRAFYAHHDDAALLSGLGRDELRRALVKFWSVWSVGFGRVRDVDAASGRIELESGANWSLFFPTLAPRYSIENVRGALDSPGEWFHDVERGQILYIPREGESAAETKAYMPLMETVVRLDGDRKNGRVVRDVAFVGIAFEHAGWDMPYKGQVDEQAHANVRAAAIVGTGVENLEIRNCQVRHVGAHGLWLRDGSRSSKVVHSLFEDLGGGGVYFGETSWSAKNAELVSGGLSIEDSVVRHGGRRLEGAVGVFVGHAHDCEILHNDICDFPYSGVSVGWTWGYRDTPNRRNKVNFNRIHHIAECRLSDVGGIYTLGDNTGGEIVGNWISEVECYPYEKAVGWGIYLDEGTSGMLVASNLVENCRDIGLNIHYGMSNRVENNVFANFNRHGFSNEKKEGHEVFRSERNIFFWTNTAVSALSSGMCNETSRERYSDRNLFWCAGSGAETKVCAGMDIDGWRKKGRDINGIVADPMFADPGKGDWTLAADSPARALGFVPFDWRLAGVLAADKKWRLKAAERTWGDYANVSKPRSCRERIDWDFESPYAVPDPKEFKYRRCQTFEPFGAAGSNGIELVDGDAFRGRRCLRLADSPDMPHDFMPHCSFRCGATKGLVHIRFAYKAEDSGDFDLLTRDYSVAGGGFASGPGFCVRSGRVIAAGVEAGEVQRGEWVEFDFAFVLSGKGRGECSLSALSGGRSLLSKKWSADMPREFSKLSWVGFVSPGRRTSSWLLDEFHFDTEREAE